tara:strand:+ start:220 stop:378 length:159 start_codon:yes stop_codon:yes gene_type:complete
MVIFLLGKPSLYLLLQFIVAVFFIVAAFFIVVVFGHSAFVTQPFAPTRPLAD